MLKEINQQIQNYLEENFLIDFTEVSAQTDLFRTGFIDSQGFVGLIVFLETTFGVMFNDEELISNTLTSLEKMCACVAQKMKEQIA